MLGYAGIDIDERELSALHPQAWHGDQFHPALYQGDVDDPETKIHAIREWAMSLHTRRRDNHVSSSSAAMPTLPPLPDIKEYNPGGATTPGTAGSSSRPGTSRSATRPGKKQHHAPVNRHELLGEYAAVQIMKAQGAGEFNPVKPPKPSSLGLVIPHAGVKPDTAPSGQFRSFNSTASRFSGSDSKGDLPRGRPMKVVNLAHFGGQGVVRGFDPMGGTLFGLDAKLDQGTRKHGIYESGLKRQTSPGRGTQLPVDTQPKMPLAMEEQHARMTFTGSHRL